MVAYKRLTIDHRDTLYREMCRRNRQNHKIHKDVSEISYLLSSYLMKDVPSEVQEFAKKYPKSIAKKERLTVSLEHFYWEKKINNESLYKFTWPEIKIYDYIYGFHPELEGEDFCSFWNISVNEFVSYVKERWPGMYENIKTVVLENLDIIEWETNLRCVLDKVNTLNQLKNEFPEAYEVYVQKIGLPREEKKKDKCSEVVNTKGETMCDVVEKLRASYNKK